MAHHASGTESIGKCQITLHLLPGQLDVPVNQPVRRMFGKFYLALTPDPVCLAGQDILKAQSVLLCIFRLLPAWI